MLHGLGLVKFLFLIAFILSIALGAIIAGIHYAEGREGAERELLDATAGVVFAADARIDRSMDRLADTATPVEDRNAEILNIGQSLIVLFCIVYFLYIILGYVVGAFVSEAASTNMIKLMIILFVILLVAIAQLVYTAWVYQEVRLPFSGVIKLATNFKIVRYIDT